MHVLSRLQRHDLQNGTSSGSQGERFQDIAASDRIVRIVFS